ncbi:hypothetical protein BABINDRAFT_159397 [Babjeviella inositovora NRRL Y-12698]|uniref:Zn(2)-C6 fungal-type domain-containing protein n=1 Tax=Babjeviella inositovora NRRL Y-12698 TaxID=984486 RepID=A0A1E3QZ57_9ASCO|nr:uncharacterized protein BABINDRAFT_159397 [Babjeviella inositovora NRRL Y-12698]ODQ82905.1 hypothetical protein BABINDRAFT_159397 [Babjeviella inositovora NRRL Y-12698]
MSLKAEHESPILEETSHGCRKRRVGKACDSCRIKKTKCDGTKPCLKCINDNKICIYTERKKPTNKSYPAGYVELLETRIDLLSRSLEKVLDLALTGNDLSFLANATLNKTPQIPDIDSSASESPPSHNNKFSINDIILRLISDEGLLDNQPLDWDKGTSIAANVSASDPNSILSAASKFAEHNRALAEASAASYAETADGSSYPQSVSMSLANSIFNQTAEAFKAAREKPRLKRKVLKSRIKQEEELQFPLEDDPRPLTNYGNDEGILSLENPLLLLSPSELSLNEEELANLGYYGLNNNMEPLDKYGFNSGFDENYNGNMTIVPDPERAAYPLMGTSLDFNTNPFRTALASFNGSGFSRPSSAILANSAAYSTMSFSDFESSGPASNFSSPDDPLLYSPSIEPQQLRQPGSLTSLTSLFENQNLSGSNQPTIVPPTKRSPKSSSSRRSSSFSHHSANASMHHRSSSAHEAGSFSPVLRPLSPMNTGFIAKPLHHNQQHTHHGLAGHVQQVKPKQLNPNM